MPGQYAELQMNAYTAIYDGFYSADHALRTSKNIVQTDALPVQLYHPVFQRFMENVSTAKPDKELLTKVYNFMTCSTAIRVLTGFHNESALIHILREYKGRSGMSGSIMDPTIRRNGSLPLLEINHSGEYGQGECDPLT